MLTVVTSPSAVHGPSAARCLTMRCLDNAPQNPFDVPDATKSSPCLNTDTPTALEWYTQSKKLARVVSHRCHGILTCNIEAPCSILRSIHGFVQNCIPTRGLVVFSWHLDHNSTRCKTVKMCSTDVVDSGCSPLASHTSTEHDLEAFQRRRSRKRAARVFWCQFAHSLGFLRNQSGSDEWIRGNTSCAEGFQPRLVQETHQGFMVNSQFAHENINSSLMASATSSSDFVA